MPSTPSRLVPTDDERHQVSVGRDVTENLILRRSRTVILGFTVLFLLAVCNWRPWRLLERAAFSSDFYDAQAHALLGLRLDVPADVASIEGFLIDDKTYLYFGPMLAIVRLPFVIFGHWADGRLVRLSLVIGFAALGVAAYLLAMEARRHLADRRPHRDDSRDDVRIAFFVAAVACSPALALFGWVSVYHETELWSAVFVVAAAVSTLVLWRTGMRRALMLSIAFVFAAVLTRASVGVGAAIGLGLVGLLLWKRDRATSAWSIGGVTGAVAVHVCVNYAKFGSLIDLPAERQVLTLQDPERAAWFAGNDGSFFGVEFVGTTLLHYLRPDTLRFERLVPIVRFGPRADDIGSYPLENNTPSSSVTAAATGLLLLALVGLVLIVRTKAWVWLVVVVGAICGTAPTFAIGFIANRYLVDMLPALMIPAAFGVLAVPVPARSAVRRAGAVLAATLVIWGTLVNVALGTWLQNLQSPGFTQVRYQLDERVFGGTAPGLVRLDAAAPVPRDGVVAIDTACRGVYVAAAERWVALERGRPRLIRGSFSPRREALVLRTTTDALEIVVSDESLRARLRTPDSDVLGDPIDWVGGDVTVEIMSDPLTGMFRVTIDGAFAVGQLGPIPLDKAEFGARFTERVSSTPLCEQLLKQL